MQRYVNRQKSEDTGFYMENKFGKNHERRGEFIILKRLQLS